MLTSIVSGLGQLHILPLLLRDFTQVPFQSICQAYTKEAVNLEAKQMLECFSPPQLVLLIPNFLYTVRDTDKVEAY